MSNTFDVLNWNQEKVGSVELDAEVFGVEVKESLLHTVVVWQLSRRRQGTHMVKTRALVRGGGKKPFKQKGTGNARQGSSRSPLMPGGAKLFGPSPRSYSYVLPKQMRKLGLKMALSLLVKENRLIVIDSIGTGSGKTKELYGKLGKIGAKRTALVDLNLDPMMSRASKNIQGCSYGTVESLNVYDLLKNDRVLISKDALPEVSKFCANRRGEG